VTSIRIVLVIAIVTMGLGGCAAIGLTGAAVGASALSAGAGAAVQAGKEYTRGGTVFRTFSASLLQTRLALGDALERMEIQVVREDDDGDDRVILAHAREREIVVRLQPVTRTVTRLRLEVAEGLFRKDRATATEIVTQTERAVTERTPVRRAARGSGASSLARGDHR
jgi:hypothetical protein